MPRTNVAGTTAPSGSGAQRCAQAGEREHRTDSTARPATATATSATAHKAKHYCRNLRCRSRLPEPVENERRAFCTRGCHESFYRNRCRVCERDLRKTGKRGDAARMYCRPPANCRREAEKWPEKYGGGQWVGFTETKLRSAHSTGTKFGIEGYPPTAHCLRDWWWGGDGDRDHSLYDRDGLTIARVVLEGDGRYHLRKPIATPRQAWAHLEEAKRGAESFALMAIPLAAVGPKLAARIKRDNETPHPMGSPLNRPPLTGDATPSDWRPTGNGADVPDIPDFLRRPVP
jgi:hypothetical protein